MAFRLGIFSQGEVRRAPDLLYYDSFDYKQYFGKMWRLFWDDAQVHPSFWGTTDDSEDEREDIMLPGHYTWKNGEMSFIRDVPICNFCITTRRVLLREDVHYQAQKQILRLFMIFKRSGLTRAVSYQILTFI